MAGSPVTTAARAATRPSRRLVSAPRPSSSARSAATPSGQDARAALEAEGVDVGGAADARPTEATGVALILVDETGENSIAVAGGANAALTLGRRSGPRSSAWRLTGEDVVLVGHEIRTGATHEALRLGRLAGATTILNPAPATGLEPARRSPSPTC